MEGSCFSCWAGAPVKPTPQAMALCRAGGEIMRTNQFLFAVLLLALVACGWWVLGRGAAAGPVAGAPRQVDPTTTAPPPPPTEPPGGTPIPTATLWLDAPYNSYAQPIYKPEATATPTQVPGTSTPPIMPTDPAATSPAHRAYAPFWIDTASTATPTPTATATISPEATPTIHLTNTPPVYPTPPSP